MYFATVTVDVGLRTATASATLPGAVVSLYRIDGAAAPEQVALSTLYVPARIAAFGALCPWPEYELIFDALVDRGTSRDGQRTYASVGAGRCWLLRCSLPRSMQLKFADAAEDGPSDVAYGVTRAEVQRAYSAILRPFSHQPRAPFSHTRGIAVPAQAVDKRQRFVSLAAVHAYYTAGVAADVAALWSTYGHSAVQHVYYRDAPLVYDLAPFWPAASLIEWDAAALRCVHARVAAADDSWRLAFGHALCDDDDAVVMTRTEQNGTYAWTPDDECARRALLGAHWPYADARRLLAHCASVLRPHASLQAFSAAVIAPSLAAGARVWRHFVRQYDAPWHALPPPSEAEESGLQFLLDYGVVAPHVAVDTGVASESDGGSAVRYSTAALVCDQRTIRAAYTRTAPWQFYHALGPSYAAAVPLIEWPANASVLAVSATCESARRFQQHSSIPACALASLEGSAAALSMLVYSGSAAPRRTPLADVLRDLDAAEPDSAPAAAALPSLRVLLVDAAHLVHQEHAARLFAALDAWFDRVVVVGDAVYARRRDTQPLLLGDAHGRFMHRALQWQRTVRLRDVAVLESPSDRHQAAAAASSASQRFAGRVPDDNAAHVRRLLHEALCRRDEGGVGATMQSIMQLLSPTVAAWIAEVSTARVAVTYARNAGADALVVCAGGDGDAMAHALERPENASADHYWRQQRAAIPTRALRKGSMAFFAERAALVRIEDTRPWPAPQAPLLAHGARPAEQYQLRLLPSPSNSSAAAPWCRNVPHLMRAHCLTTRRLLPYVGASIGRALVAVLAGGPGSFEDDDADASQSTWGTAEDVYAAAQAAQQSFLLVAVCESPHAVMMRLFGDGQ
jgi:hypothetical protein